MSRKIIHVDCDCFYASVEMRDDSGLRGRPIAVGGDPGKRGVLTTCNYEAREYGIRSAMASAHALRLCPDLIIVPVNMGKYRQVSQEIRKIFFEYTDLVEPLSLDEAYLDVSLSECCRGSATLMAEEIRQRVFETTGVTVSAGVAPNKFLAKVASDWHKPNGLFVVTPEQSGEFVRALPVNKIFGVGKVTAQKLERLGVETCGDLQAFSIFELDEKFGKFGRALYDFARGEDDRPVKPSRRRKSLSIENTYDSDIVSLEALLAKLPDLYVAFKGRLNRLDDTYQVTKSFVKLKFSDFTSTTLERGVKQPAIADFREMLAEAWQRSSLDVRLIGIGVRFIDLSDAGQMRQLQLFE